ncbi:MAG: hypothetical protein IH987_19550 [Planctomycetes bacterium]|nr:hypothetical protein [Planctomycetota bacterium]
MHDDEIVAIESRLRAVTSQTAQSITDSEKATERHDEIARQLVADLQEKCERTQADALADHYKTIQENHETQARRLDEVVASTEKRLTELDRRATAIAERIVESSKQNAAQLESEEKRLRDTLDEAFVDCKQTQSAMVTRLQQVAEEARGLQEKALSELARTTKEFDDLIDHAKITNTDLIATQHRGENLLRETHAATGKIESMNHNVSQTLVDIGSASERVGQAREQLQAAEQVAARLIAAIDSGERIESKLDEVTGNAADLRDAFVRTSAEAETKLGQLGSHSAAAAHVLSKLSEANIDAHDVLERTTKTMMAARETGENTKSEMERLLKDVSSLKNTVETAAAEMTDGTEHAVALTKRLGKVIRTANELSGELTGELTGRTDEAKQSAETLDRQCTQANTLIDRLGNSAQLLDGAGQVQTDLVESIDQARVIDVELRSTADDAVVKTAQLETNRQSASELIEAHEGLSAQTRDLIVQLDLGIADARSTTEASQQLLEQYTRHGKTLHGVLERLGRRANKLEESLDQLTEKPSTIVAEAQAQAAQLEQVCSAVGRVFAKLSKASLEAHEQTKECHRASKTAFERLEQLRSETDGTSRSLQTWLEHTLRVGGELAQSLGSTRTNLRAPTPGEQAVRIANRSAEDPDFTEIDTAKTDRPYGETGGDILKTAEAPRSIENPTALAMARKPGRAKEIAGMIADAKAADTAKT